MPVRVHTHNLFVAVVIHVGGCIDVDLICYTKQAHVANHFCQQIVPTANHWEEKKTQHGLHTDVYISWESSLSGNCFLGAWLSLCLGL